MGKSIFKYQLKGDEDTVLKLPKDSVILTCQIDEKTDRPCIWFLQDNDKEPVHKRTFRFFGTGSELPEDNNITDEKLQYISTIQMFKGILILHLFELC